MSEKVRILLIEDSEDDALLIERVLKKGGLEATIERVSTGDEVNQVLEEKTWDAVLCDYMMPNFSIKDAMKQIGLRGLDLPFIIVSGTISDEVAVEMMQAGAHDYLTKNNLSRLVPAIRREIGEAEQRKKRRAAEQALRESERKHRTLVESLSDTVFVLDPEGEVSEFYSKTGIIPGISPRKYIGRKISDLLPAATASRYTNTTKTVLETGETQNFEHPIDIVDPQRWVSVNISPHEDGERVVVVIRDVSALKKAEEEARAAHNVALLYQDITGHDIRNYLQAIMIASDLLYIDEVEASRVSLLDHINGAVSECSELIANVQTTATLLTTPLEKVSLDLTLKSCIEVFLENHDNASIVKKIPKTQAVIQGDRFLNHLIMNILSNAEKYNEKERKKIWVEMIEDDDGYTVTIADDGPGISDDMKKNLLDPERRSGGVGIHQCMQITSKYHGTFEILDRVEGDHAQGAQFKLWFLKANK